MDVDLIYNLIVWIMKECVIDEGFEGVILVFLFGWDEIFKFCDSLMVDYNVCYLVSVLFLYFMVVLVD